MRTAIPGKTRKGRIDHHGTMFWHAAKEGLVDPKQSVQIGLRTTNDDTLGFNIFDGPFVHREGIETVVAETRKILGDSPVYLSFDIDCLDPSYAPGTGTPVCGGTDHKPGDSDPAWADRYQPDPGDGPG